MTKREAAVVTAYTGILLGDFDKAHEYIEEILGRPVLSHELGNSDVWVEIKEAARADFVDIEVEEEYNE